MNSKDNEKEVTISNWTTFGSSSVNIEVFENVIDHEIYYTSALGFFLDDGKPDSPEKHITVFTEIGDECLHCCIKNTAYSIRNLFDFISDTVFVFGEDGEIFEEISLNEITKDDDFEDNFDTIHTN